MVEKIEVVLAPKVLVCSSLHIILQLIITFNEFNSYSLLLRNFFPTEDSSYARMLFVLSHPIRYLCSNFPRFSLISRSISTAHVVGSFSKARTNDSNSVPKDHSTEIRSSLYIQRTARYPPVTMPAPIDIHLAADESTRPILEAQLDQYLLSARSRCQSLSFDKSSFVRRFFFPFLSFLFYCSCLLN